MRAMSRGVSCLIAGLLLSCGSEGTNGERRASIGADSLGQPGVLPTASASMPLPETECEPVDGSQDRCDNLLQDGWRLLKHGGQPVPEQKQLLAKLADSLNSIATRLQSDNDTQFRNVEQGCAPKDTFEVTYRAPQAMLHFPSGGTGRRDIVVGMFTPRPKIPPTGCGEKMFGHRDPSNSEGGFTRVHQFVVVNVPVRPDTGDGKKDVPIGKWTSWTLSRRVVFRDTTYRLRGLRVEEKSYYWCAAKHGGGTVRYLTCDAQRRLMEAVQTGKALTLDEAFSRYQRRDSTLVDGANKRIRQSLDDGAWGRCGNLGCCVSI